MFVVILIQIEGHKFTSFCDYSMLPSLIKLSVFLLLITPKVWLHIKQTKDPHNIVRKIQTEDRWGMYPYNIIFFQTAEWYASRYNEKGDVWPLLNRLK